MSSAVTLLARYRALPRLRLRVGIRARVILLTFGLGSLFIAYVVYGTANQSMRDRDHARALMRLVAATTSSRLDDHVGNIEQLLLTLSGTLSAEPADRGRNDTTLRELMARVPRNVGTVSVWALDGSNVGSSDRQPAGARPNVRGRAFFDAALRLSGLASEAPAKGHGGEWLATFALPIVKDGRPVGVISATTGLQSLTSLLNDDSILSDGAVVTVIEGHGTIVARSLEADAWIGRPAPITRTLLLRRLAQGNGSTETRGLDGIERIAGFARSRWAPWLVYVGMPVDVVLAEGREHARSSLLLGIVTLAGGLVLAAWVAGRIALPLRQLSADAALLASGQLAHRSSVRSSSEAGRLAHAFNRMASALQERATALRRSEERLSLALEGAEQSMFDWDIAGDRIYHDANAAVMRGLPGLESEVDPSALRALVHPDDVAQMLARLKATLRGDTATYEAEFRVRRHDGGWLWLRSRGRVVERDGDGRALRMVGTDADISKRRADEAELRRRAEFDTLTGLVNRAVFNDRLANAVARAARSDRALAVFFLDIDHFKRVNDTHGHETGDELLKVVAARLSASVRAADTVARLAGDEFTVLLEGFAALEEAEAVARKLVAAMRWPIEIGDATLKVTISIGVAMLDEGETEASSLLRRADTALYEAKRLGRDRYAVDADPARADRHHAT